MKYKKENYNKFINLYIRNKWLIEKSKEVEELINFCDNHDSQKLIFDLLERFIYLDQDNYNLLLNNCVEFIFDFLNYEEQRTQVLALAFDDEADSSQAVLHSIKHKICKKGWNQFATVNKFGAGIKHFNKGKNQIIIVDEFIGSGKTVKNRIDYLSKNITGNFEYHCLFISGIESTVNRLNSEGYNIFCALPLKKGISEYYLLDELKEKETQMLELELKLSQKINNKPLYDYSFGYGGAEALYSMEGCGGNTPNSVFPIFWWNKDFSQNQRNTILTRYELGL